MANTIFVLLIIQILINWKISGQESIHFLQYLDSLLPLLKLQKGDKKKFSDKILIFFIRDIYKMLRFYQRKRKKKERSDVCEYLAFYEQFGKPFVNACRLCIAKPILESACFD